MTCFLSWTYNLPYLLKANHVLLLYSTMYMKWIRWQQHMERCPCSINHIGATCACLFGTSCNTLVLSIAFGTCIHEHKHHPSIHEHEHMEISSYSYILSHVMLIIYMHMLVTMCDQCKRWSWGHKNTLDTSRMVNGTMLLFMTWANFASKCWFTLKYLLHDASLTKVEQ